MKRCARCGKRLPATELRVFSQFSRVYYCAEVDKCGRRAKKKLVQIGESTASGVGFYRVQS